MSRPERRRRRAPGAVTALVVALALALAGCASLPTDGPVEEGAGATPTAAATPFDFNPPGPTNGAAPDEIVTGFLDALQATPVSTNVAQEYLTPQSADAWRPDRGTIVYGGQQTSGVGPVVDVALSDAFQLDRRGRWAGQWSDGAGTLRFRLTQVGGQWRIQDPPDAMIVPRSHFESRYQEYSLFFLDPSGAVLVPEPVYLPRGVQAPTQLMAGLLDGPVAGARQVERSFIPEGTKLGVGVPVGPDGLARVALSDAVLDLDEDALGLAAAQIAWTLGQLRDVNAFQITVDGNPVEFPGGSSVVDVDSFNNLDPTVSTASPDLFGLQGRDVVQVVGEQEVIATSLPQDAPADFLPARSVGVDLASQRFALVDHDGGSVLVIGRTEDREAHSPYSGTDVLRPMWDRTNDLWLVDRTGAGSRVTVLAQGRTRVLLERTIRGGKVRAATLSRDGSRLAVAQRTAAGFRLLLFRVVRDGAGRPVRLTAPIELSSAEGLRHPIALGWRDPTTVAVLVRPSETTTRLGLVSCDGATDLAGFEPAVDTLFDRGVALAASPGGPMALYVAAASRAIHALTLQGRWELDAVDAGIRAPTFVG